MTPYLEAAFALVPPRRIALLVERLTPLLLLIEEPLVPLLILDEDLLTPDVEPLLTPVVPLRAIEDELLREDKFPFLLIVLVPLLFEIPLAFLLFVSYRRP